MSQNEQENDVPELLIEAAARLFLKKDFHSVSIREIAEEAGVSSAMINYYFKSKNGLFEAMIKAKCELIQSKIQAFIGHSTEIDFTKW